jgi:hypothetical protein
VCFVDLIVQVRVKGWMKHRRRIVSGMEFRRGQKLGLASVESVSYRERTGPGNEKN